MSEPARKNVGAAPIANRKYSTCLIFTIRNPDVWGELRGQTRARSGDYHVKRNNIQSESEMMEDGSITNAVMAQHKVKLMWTAEMEDQLVDLWQQHKCLYNVLCKTFPNTIIAISSCISSAMLILKSRKILRDFLCSQSRLRLKIC